VIRSDEKADSIHEFWVMLIPEPSIEFTYPGDISFACSRCGMCCGDTASARISVKTPNLKEDFMRLFTKFMELMKEEELYKR